MSETIPVDQAELSTNYFIVVSIEQKQQGDDQHWVVHVRDKTTTNPFDKFPTQFRLAHTVDTAQIETDVTAKITWMPTCTDEPVAVAIEVVDASEVKNSKIVHRRPGEPEYIRGVGCVATVEQLVDRDTLANQDNWVLWLDQDPRVFITNAKEASQLVGKCVTIKAVAADASEFDFDKAISVYRVVELQLVEETNAPEPRAVPAKTTEVEMTEAVKRGIAAYEETVEAAVTSPTQGRVDSRRVAELNDGTVYYEIALVGQPGLYIWPNKYWLGGTAPQVEAEVIFEWERAEGTWLKEVKGGYPVRIITSYRVPQPEGISVEVSVPEKLLNQNVAVVKNLSPANRVWNQNRTTQMHTMQVKHRDGGPKCYNLMFRPNEAELQQDRIVRVYWAAKDDEAAEKIGLAIRVDVLGDVQYRDGK